MNIFYKALGNFAEFSLVALGNKYELIEILRLKYQRSRSRPDQIQKGYLSVNSAEIIFDLFHLYFVTRTESGSFSRSR